MTPPRSLWIPHDWLVSQQILFACTFLASQPAPTHTEQIMALKGRLWRDQLPLEGDETRAYAARLDRLSASALYALTRLPPEISSAWAAHRPFWVAAVKRRERPGAPHCLLPLTGAARLLADRLLCGDLKGEQLVRLARQELGGPGWRPDAPLVEALEVLRRSLGRSTMFDRTRFRALKEFRNALGGVLPAHWPLVEDAIVTRSLAWPALVVKQGKTKDSSKEAPPLDWTIPLLVSLDFSGGQGVKFRNLGDRINHDSWEKLVGRAWRTAFDLWLLKREHLSNDFKKQIGEAGVILDFEVVSRILQPFPGVKLDLADRSLEGYLSILLGAPLVDPRGMELTVATGWRGDRVPNGRKRDLQVEGADYKVLASDHAEIKARIFAHLGATQLLAAPEASLDGAPEGIRIISRAEYISDLLDQVYGQVWHKHVYTLAPDQAFALKSPPADEREKEQRKKVLDFFEENSAPVVTLPADIPADAILRALYTITQETKDRASYAVIRILPGQTGLRLWRVVWEAVGGPRGDWPKLLTSSGPEAGRVLAKAMNWFTPTPERPNRAPDVVILLGARRLEGSTDPRHGLDAVLPGLLQNLTEDHPVGLKNGIGRTRIILSPNDWVPKATEDDPWPGFGAEHKAALRRLSVLEYGFTELTALAMLQRASNRPPETLFAELLELTLPDGQPAIVRPLPQSVVRNKYAPERRSSPVGQYYMPVRAALPDDERAELEFEAAHALTGYLLPERAPRLDFRHDFSIVRLHEAQMRLERVSALGGVPESRLDAAIRRLERVSADWGWARQHLRSTSQPPATRRPVAAAQEGRG